MLGVLLGMPLIGGIFLIGMSNVESILEKKSLDLRVLGLWISLLTFVVSLKIWIEEVYNVGSIGRFVLKEEWLGVSLGVDSVSILFILLTTLLFPICILGVWEVSKKINLYIGLLLIMEGLILIVFSVLDLIIFYVFFESVLIPMYLIMGIWGSRERKVKAGYYLFLYTLFGSIWMLLSILVMYWEVGTFNYETILLEGIREEKQYLLWLGLFIGLGVKVPMVPVHIWLPEAHVEAPTVGSVILAGVLLKLGTYGMIRFLIPLLPVGTEYFIPFVYVLSIIGVIYGSLSAIRQADMKRVIAYGSIGHMSITIIGIFSGVALGNAGGILQMISHGLVSGGLFLCVGVLYERHHSRLIKYYSGVVSVMPLFSILFLILMMGNIGLPGTSSFVGELLVIIGVLGVNKLVGLLGGSSMILGGVYSLWLYNRVVFGNINSMLVSARDITRREFSMLLPLIVLVLIIGVYPNILLNDLV